MTVGVSFWFNAEDHTYWLGHEQVLGCTEALDEIGLIDKTFYTDAARERGHVVHQATAARDRKADAKVTKPLTKQLHARGWDGYAASWELFVAQWVEQWLLIEQPLCSGLLRIGGTPDRVGIIRAPGVRHIAVVDPKTGDIEPWHRYQASIYILLVQEWMKAKAAQLARLYPFLDIAQPPLHYGVYLKEDGTPPKIRAYSYERCTPALITAAQVRRSLYRTRRS